MTDLATPTPPLPASATRPMAWAVGLAAVLVLQPSLAVALDAEVGALLALHRFAATNEIGRTDSDPAAYGPGVGAGVRGGVWLTQGFATEAEFTITRAQRNGVDYLLSTARAHAVARVRFDALALFVLAGGGAMRSAPGQDVAHGVDTDAFSHLGAGVAWSLSQRIRLRADVRAQFTGTTQPGETISTDGEATLGLSFAFGGSEPAPPRRADVVVLDADGDEVLEADDACPFEPETRNGVRDHDGCPEDPRIAERAHTTQYFNEKDGQVARLAGSRSAQAAAAATPGPAGVDAGDFVEVPLAATLTAAALPPLLSAGDDDGDGLVRDDDVCPEVPEDLDGFADGDGCPEPDDDGDGFLDAADKCPREGETVNGIDDGDGCADAVPKPVAAVVGTMKGLEFEKGSARITPKSFPALQRVADVLARFPALRVEIAGHTDDKGLRATNTTLSRQRAESVRTWLVERGAQAGHVRAAGYGPDKPLVPNKNNKNRAKNRRVEFVLLPGDADGGAP